MAGDERALVKKEGGNRRERREKEKKGKASGVDNTFRRTWDKDEYAEKAEAREKVSPKAYDCREICLRRVFQQVWCTQ